MSRSMESMDQDIVTDSPMNALRRPAHRIVDSRRFPLAITQHEGDNAAITRPTRGKPP